MNKYIGNPMQIRGVEEHRLCGGKGDGMRLFQIRNGKGLEITVSADRCADISRLTYKGVNFGFFSPCGYVAPSYYDSLGAGFLKSFTAGFFTTCGLTAVGSPCNDNGEELPLHGSISNTPAENIYYTDDDNFIYLKATVRDAALFAHKLLLKREYKISLSNNSVELCDTVTNTGSEKSPFMMLYHCNMGYPLLCEDTKVYIDAGEPVPRNVRAAEGLDKCRKMEKPQKGFEEQCYYYDMKKGRAGVFNEEIGAGLLIEYNTSELPCFTEWKMMGEQEYVLGLEPGNCTPDGRDVLRRENRLKFLEPGEKAVHHIKFELKDKLFF